MFFPVCEMACKVGSAALAARAVLPAPLIERSYHRLFGAAGEFARVQVSDQLDWRVFPLAGEGGLVAALSVSRSPDP